MRNIIIFFIIAMTVTVHSVTAAQKISATDAIDKTVRVVTTLPTPLTTITYFNYIDGKHKNSKIAGFRLVLKNKIEPLPALSTYSKKLKGFTKIAINLNFSFYLQRAQMNGKDEKWDIVGTTPPPNFKIIIFLKANDRDLSLEQGTPPVFLLQNYLNTIQIKLSPRFYLSKKIQGQWGLALHVDKAMVRLSYKDSFALISHSYSSYYDFINAIIGESVQIKRTIKRSR